MEPITKIDIDMATEDAIYITLLGGRKLKYIPEKQAQQDFMELYEAADKANALQLSHGIYVLDNALFKAQESPLYNEEFTDDKNGSN